ncbi:MAG: SufE family protein [Candidatus Dadabacteria bacterium]|nr:SufE family protein [Candidatus Dadabacteria bacterium]
MARIQEIVREFEGADQQEMINLLIDYSEDLPEIPQRLAGHVDRDLHRVHECETPVFIWVEVADGRVSIFADVPEPFPTVKGLVSILISAFDGLTPREIESSPADFISRLGLAQRLGIRRVRGLSAVYARIKSEVRKHGAVT